MLTSLHRLQSRIIKWPWIKVGTTDLSSTSWTTILGVLSLDAAGVSDGLRPVVSRHGLVANLEHTKYSFIKAVVVVKW